MSGALFDKERGFLLQQRVAFCPGKINGYHRRKREKQRRVKYVPFMRVNLVNTEVATSLYKVAIQETFFFGGGAVMKQETGSIAGKGGGYEAL